MQRLLAASLAGLALTSTLAACGSGGGDDQQAVASKNGITQIAIAEQAGAYFHPVDVTVSEDEKLAASVPAKIRSSGKLTIGIGGLPSAYPPLVVVGTDQRTITGSEPDFGRLVAAKLGLTPVIDNSTWENLFIGISGGRNDVGISNITDTEERKRKYDFASYRHDDLAFEVLKKATWKFTGDPSVLAGKTVAVGAGTNQERILLQWKKQLAAQGKTITVKYFPDAPGTNLALASGRIDAYLAPNPTIRYHVAQVAKTQSATKVAGNYSGAGASLQGLIAATTVKGNGLAQPIQGAINELIADGTYAKWLAAYNLSSEAVPTSQLNPPGLPLTSS